MSERRGEKIKGKIIFNGEVWDAVRAKELGLIDGIGIMEDILEEKYVAYNNVWCIKTLEMDSK